MAATKPTTDNNASERDPFAWDPDPVVLVSKRPRRLYFPRLLIDRDPTTDEIKAWTTPPDPLPNGATRPGPHLPSVRQDQWIVAQTGVTFLGTFSTSWADLLTVPGHAPALPNMQRAILAQPVTQAQAAIIGNPANKDHATGRMRPDKVRTIFERVFRYLREHRHPSTPDLWTSVDGYDAPEMMLLPLSELFTQSTAAGQHAHAMVFKSIPHLRRVVHETVAPLGVLHDYAIRSRSGGASAILGQCRAMAAKWKMT